MHRLIRILVLFLCSAAVSFGQSVPRAGTRFTFAIPEGGDLVFNVTSQIIVNVLSAHDGQGVLWSPSGTTIPFTFRAGQATVIKLPYDLILLNDLGKSQRGIIVRTTQPANLTLHNILDYAGEATQIWPDAALDTLYLVPGWGVWNDYQEDNRSQVTVVASENNTTVTLRPTVDCLGGEQKNKPVTTTLQRGECYVLKADTSGEPRQYSLFRTRILSDKPVSVLTSSTCAYVPLANQACNELLDHLLPTKNVGTDFYVATPTDTAHKCRILFISDTNTFFVFSSGSTSQASNGRVEVAITGPAHFTTSAPAQCYLLTDGSDNYFFSDPSIVTILPSDQYEDTLSWYAPRILIDSINPMFHFLSLVYPSANEQEIMLDNTNAISPFTMHTQITGTSMSAAMIRVDEGVHQLESPVPVFGIAYGFLIADAYSFVIMGKGDRIDIDSADFTLRSSVPNARTCEVFGGSVYLEDGFDASEEVYRLRLTVTYDPVFLRLVNAAPSGILSGLDVTLDTSTPGMIVVNVISQNAPIVGGGDLLSLSFFGKGAGTTSLRSHLSVSQLDFLHLETATQEYSETIDIAQTRYSAQVAMSVVTESVPLGEYTLGHIFIDDAVNGLFSEVRVRVAYDHDLLELVEVVEPNTKLKGWSYSSRKVDFETDEFTFTPVNPTLLQGNGTLTRFRFLSYVSRNDTTTIRASATLRSADVCPLDIEGTQGADLFEGIDLCGMRSIRASLRGLPFEFLDVTPNPTAGQIDAFIRHSFTVGSEIECRLADPGGKRLWTTTASLATAPEAHLQLTFPAWIGSGTYMLTLEAGGYAASRQIVIIR